MTINAETFYQANCDAEGCRSLAPTDNDDGSSHYPLDLLREWMAEGHGWFEDETWTELEDGRTFCPRHKPGNVDCEACGGYGHFRHPDGPDITKRFTDCVACDARGYVVLADATPPSTDTDRSTG